ncbi:MAG: LytTR family DNA-binding domain-containing protein [Sediminibacterium sp.]
MLQALLVDDEENNLESLRFLLENDCEQVQVTGMLRNASDAREWLKKNKVDVIFLDINMPGENGFQFLESFSNNDHKIVFVTAYDQYAIQAIKASALDYILKPVGIDELQAAVEKVRRSLNSPVATEQTSQLFAHFLQTLRQKNTPQKIALPHLGGINFVEVDDMVSLQADSNYTIIHMKNMQKLVISKTLKDFEELLDPSQFARIHKSYIIHLKYLKEYSTTDGGIVKMTDGNQWSVSRRQLDLFLEKMKTASLMFGNK